MKQTRLRWLLGPVLGYLCVVGLMAAFETTLVFPAPSIAKEDLSRAARSFGATEIDLKASDSTPLYGWRVGETDRLVLYFSGNGSSVGEGQFYRFLHKMGLSTLHINYRGYPGSGGSPSEMGIALDAQAAWKEARKTHRPDQILVMGKSLGGGVAVGLVAGLSDEQPAGLVLESTFTSAMDVGAEAYPWLPVRWIMRTRFDSLSVAHQIRCPTLVLHGGSDTMIGPHHGQHLAAAIPDATHIEVPGQGHNERLLTYPRAKAALLQMLR